MSRSRLLFFAVSFALVVPILSVSLWAAAKRQDPAPEEDSLYKYLSVFTEVLGLIRQSYVDPQNVDTLMNGALDGAADAMDPFSVYLPAGEAEGYTLRSQIEPGPSGMLVLKEHGIAFVTAIGDDSPAAKADVQRGDIVASIRGESTRRMPLWKIWQLLDGKPGEKLELQVIRSGSPQPVTIELAAPALVPAQLETKDEIPVLHLARIGRETPMEVRRILGGLPDAQRLVVDLRSVAFGDIPSAYEVGKLFATGELGALLQRGGAAQTFTGGAAPLWKGNRLVVLVDRATLGPGEVLASILRQRADATLVGEDTFGYAGRQTLLPLSSGARLQLTDGFYTGPDKKPIDAAIEPDVAVDELSRSFSEQEKSLRDLILERGLGIARGQDPLPHKQAA